MGKESRGSLVGVLVFYRGVEEPFGNQKEKKPHRLFPLEGLAQKQTGYL